MSNWIQEGIAALEHMRGEIDGALATLRKLQVTPPPAPLGPPLGARPPRQAKKQPTTKSTAAPASPAAADVVQARDAAILAALKRGKKPFSELLEALPRQTGQNDDQRQSACRNALTRLRVKKLIELGDDGNWELV